MFIPQADAIDPDTEPRKMRNLTLVSLTMLLHSLPVSIPERYLSSLAIVLAGLPNLSAISSRLAVSTNSIITGHICHSRRQSDICHPQHLPS